MSDSAAVDVAHIQRLSKEFWASATELKTRILRFREQTANTHGAYGETQDADEAEREYQQTVRLTLEYLENMHTDLVRTAERLAEQARISRDAAAETEAMAAGLQKDM